MSMKLSIKQILIVTAVFANVLLLALLWAKPQITIPPLADEAMANMEQQTTTIEYEFELENVSVSDGWRMEHYRQYELTVSESGEVLSKKPTEETQNMKYWTGK